MLLFMYTRNLAKIKADAEYDDTTPKRKRERINHEEFVNYIIHKYSPVLKKEEIESLKIEAVTSFTKLRTLATMWKTIDRRPQKKKA